MLLSSHIFSNQNFLFFINIRCVYPGFVCLQIPFYYNDVYGLAWRGVRNIKLLIKKNYLICTYMYNV